MMITIIGCRNEECNLCENAKCCAAPTGGSLLVTKIKDKIDDNFYCASVVNAFLNTKHDEVRFGYCNGGKPMDMNVLVRLKTGVSHENPISYQAKRKQTGFRESVEHPQRNFPHAYHVS